MSYRFSRDPETVKSLRAIMGDPQLLGARAKTASDDEIIEAAEAFANTMMAAGTKLGMELREFGAKMAKAFGPLARWAERFRRENPTAFEQLMEKAK